GSGCGLASTGLNACAHPDECLRPTSVARPRASGDCGVVCLADVPRACPPRADRQSRSLEARRPSAFARPNHRMAGAAPPHDAPTLVETPIATAVPGFSPTQD